MNRRTAKKPARGKTSSQRRPGSRKRRATRLLAPSEIIERLDAEAPIPPWRAHGDPVAELVLTLLSQNTSDTNSGRAYQSLVARFPDWDAVLAAPVGEIEAAIRIGGLAKTKAPRLKALLAELRERWGDEWDASQLKTLPLPEAKAWLTSLPGVGPKTAACVLLFALKRPALPVDTHVHRVCQRLGLINEKNGRRRRTRAARITGEPGASVPVPRRIDPARAPRMQGGAPSLRAMCPIRPMSQCRVGKGRLG